jgi:hypothetical protein
MNNIQKVIAELTDIKKESSSLSGRKRLSACIESLASISLQLRKMGLELQKYGVTIYE